MVSSMFPAHTCHFFPVSQWGHFPQNVLGELNHFNGQRSVCFFSKLHVSCSCCFWCMWCFCYQLLQWPPTLGQRGRKRVEGRERRAHAWACCPLHEQVKDTGRWPCLSAVSLCSTSLKILVRPRKLYKMFQKSIPTGLMTFFETFLKRRKQTFNSHWLPESLKRPLAAGFFLTVRSCSVKIF